MDTRPACLLIKNVNEVSNVDPNTLIIFGVAIGFLVGAVFATFVSLLWFWRITDKAIGDKNE